MKIEIVQKLLKDGMIAEEEADIVEYGLRNMLHNLVGIFITLIIGWIFGSLKEGIILLFLIVPLRKYDGGFHANTRKGCLISSTCLLIIFFEIFFKIKWTSEECIFLSIIFFFIILALVPVENPNKRLDDLEHKGLFLITNGEIYNITSDILDIICLCNGKNGVEEICIHFPTFKQKDIMEVIDFWINEGVLTYTQQDIFVSPIVDEKHPTSITVELTYRCNEQCAFCISDAGRKFYNQNNIIDMELQKSDIDKILQQMYELRISLLTLTGGEPLLRKELLYYTIYEAQRKNINVALLTNATLINEKIARELSEFSNLLNIQISLDGIDDVTHDFLRNRKGSFNESLNAINFLKKNGIKPSLSFVLNKLNYEQYPDMLLLAEQLNLQLRMAPVVPIGRGKENSDYLLTNNQITEFLKYTHRTSDGKLSARIMPRERCSITTSPAIDPFGNIYPCMHMKFLEFKLGNIRSEKIKDIWDNSLVIKELQNYNKHKNSDCKGCWNKYICDGCIGAAYSYYQTIYKRDPYRCMANRNYTKSLLSEGDNETKEQLEPMIDKE